MPRFKRCFTKTEAEEIKPYLKYYGDDVDLDTIYTCLKNGWLFRTPVIERIATNYKIAKPGEKLPDCLKI